MGVLLLLVALAAAHTLTAIATSPLPGEEAAGVHAELGKAHPGDQP